MLPHQEIELKLRLTTQQKTQVLKKLNQLGAQPHPVRHQIDTLFNCDHINFKQLDQSLRLRIETVGKKKIATLTFKGTPQHSPDGHKTRDEFNTPANPEATPQLLQAIGFYPTLIIEKARSPFTIGKLEVAIDELKFGTFLELEGTPQDIQRVRRQLGLQTATPIKLGYGNLQLTWEYKHKR
jgi:predicted adenylyl cyclase CyaB